MTNTDDNPRIRGTGTWNNKTNGGSSSGGSLRGVPCTPTLELHINWIVERDFFEEAQTLLCTGQPGATWEKIAALGDKGVGAVEEIVAVYRQGADKAKPWMLRAYRDVTRSGSVECMYFVELVAEIPIANQNDFTLLEKYIKRDGSQEEQEQGRRYVEGTFPHIPGAVRILTAG